MQPNPRAETCNPVFPKVLVFMLAILQNIGISRKGQLHSLEREKIRGKEENSLELSFTLEMSTFIQ
jgi:hypothetical protein